MKSKYYISNGVFEFFNCVTLLIYYAISIVPMAQYFDIHLHNALITLWENVALNQYIMNINI